MSGSRLLPAKSTAVRIALGALSPCLLLIGAVAQAQINQRFHSGFEGEETAQACTDKSVRVVNGRRLNFAFPNRDDQAPGSLAESACLRFTGVQEGERFAATRAALISRNGGVFQSSPVSINNGDTIRLRLTVPLAADASETSNLSFGGAILGSYTVRARNAAAAPRLLRVGPGRSARELSEVAASLQAGDVVELDRGATYQSVEFTRAGRAGAPITLRAAAGAGAAPLLSGGIHTLSLRGAHHYRIEGVEISGGSQTCVRIEANEVELRDSQIHGCPRHGVLAADFNSGSLRLVAVEIHDAGGVLPGENLKHPVYVATDRDRYPGATLRVERSYIHDFGGNGVKSRAERAEIYHNWIEADAGSIYSLEFNGYEEYESIPALQADVFGNVLIHRHVYGLRMGGDGTGALRGRVRMAHNTLLQAASFDQFTPVLRFFGELDAVVIRNNVFARLADGAANPALRIVRDDATWLRGARALDAVDNAVPQGSQSIAAGYLPVEFSATRLLGAPGYLDLGVIGLDLQRAVDAAINAAPQPSQGAAGFSPDRPRVAFDSLPPRQRPLSGQPLREQWIAPLVGQPEALGAR